VEAVTRADRALLLCAVLALLALACAPAAAAARKPRAAKLALIASPRAGLSPLLVIVTALVQDPDRRIRSCPWISWHWSDGQVSRHELHCGEVNTGRFSDYQTRCLTRGGEHQVYAVVTAHPNVRLHADTTILAQGDAWTGCQ
jgi:hypothetical protein